MRLSSYRDLHVWQRSMALLVECYGVARELPRFETYGLATQVRRAASSIPANIAEGYGRLRRREYLYFLGVARGSLMELRTHVESATLLEYLSPERVRRAEELAEQTSQMLTALIRSLAR